MKERKSVGLTLISLVQLVVQQMYLFQSLWSCTGKTGKVFCFIKKAILIHSNLWRIFFLYTCH